MEYPFATNRYAGYQLYHAHSAEAAIALHAAVADLMERAPTLTDAEFVRELRALVDKDEAA